MSQSQAMQLLTSAETVEWYTPRHIIDKARAVLGHIDCDPASNDVAQSWIQAATYGTKEKPLAQWLGTVWLNPPYDKTAIWVERLEREYLSGNVSEALALVNANLGYDWFERLWRAWPVVCLEKRLYFVQADGRTKGQAKKPQAIIYFGRNVQKLRDAFGDIGRVILPDTENRACAVCGGVVPISRLLERHDLFGASIQVCEQCK